MLWQFLNLLFLTQATSPHFWAICPNPKIIFMGKSCLLFPQTRVYLKCLLPNSPPCKKRVDYKPTEQLKISPIIIHPSTWHKRWSLCIYSQANTAGKHFYCHRQSDPTSSENFGRCLSLHPSSTLRTQMEQGDISIMLHRKKDRQGEGNRLAQDNRQAQQTKKSNLGLLTSYRSEHPSPLSEETQKHQSIFLTDKIFCSHPIRLGSRKITWLLCPEIPYFQVRSCHCSLLTI